jgi:hypothetical protein
MESFGVNVCSTAISPSAGADEEFALSETANHVMAEKEAPKKNKLLIFTLKSQH